MTVLLVFREKANLAVTVTTAKNEVLAHAAFLDYPMGDEDPAKWEFFLPKHYQVEKCTVCFLVIHHFLCLLLGVKSI